MDNKNFTAEKITVNPVRIQFYVPPVVWKGDAVGHIGKNDVFFWLLEGEMALFVEKECYIMRAGQLAFLPKGKFRRYTALSKDFSLYTMSFVAESDGENLMKGLGLGEKNHVVNVEDPDRLTKYFETSSYVGMQKDPINNFIWNTNIMNIIKEFCECSEKQMELKDERLDSAILHMQNNLNKNITIEDLASLVFMQPTYFIRRFKKVYSASPMAYFKSLRINKAMELLLTTDNEIENIAKELGIDDASYFSRWFKKSCGIPPAECRKSFLKQGM